MKYPLEVASVVRQQTFYINLFLGQAKTENNEAPLMFFDRFSRLATTIINQNKVPAMVNISMAEFNDIKNRSKFAFAEEMKALYLQSEKAESVSKAYTVTFTAGNLKGKTPAQVLLEASDKNAGIETLRSQYAFLRDNVSRYPKNAEIMAAINEAVKLLQAGKLSAEAQSTSGTKEILIYHSGFKPQIRKKREDGMAPVHQCEITWSLKSAYPVTVKITNCYAPVVQLEDGKLNVVMAQKDQKTVITNTMSLTAAEWMNAVENIERNIDLFTRLTFKSALDDAQRTHQANMQASAG